MEIVREKDKAATSRAAAAKASSALRKAIDRQGAARFCVATGSSQFDFLQALTSDRSIDWSRTTMFHLDEYTGISENHPASFRRYLRERLVDRVQPGEVHFIRGEAPDPQAECRRISDLIRQGPIDVAFIGIGENGHLAFNDPPADFETEEPYILVTLDMACRRQQVSEGWFASIDKVPAQAVSMSIRQIMSAESIVCTVPGIRKAEAVRNCVEGEVTPLHPSSILQTHTDCHLYLDLDSASLLGTSSG